MQYYRWDTEEREDLSKEAEDEAVVPGTPAVLLLRNGTAACGSSAVLPLGCAILPLEPRQDIEKRRDLFQEVEELGG